MTLASPWIFVMAEFQAKRILGLSLARWAMIREARSSPLRTTTVTDLPKRVRKVASSMAESPPPTTMMSCSRKKKPSHVAHQETPWPLNFFSSGRPSSL